MEESLPPVSHAAWVARCVESLRDAVASRNGSIRDAHMLALAWRVEGDIWISDRDFAGTGVANWSTANLERGLVGEVGLG